MNKVNQYTVEFTPFLYINYQDNEYYKTKGYFNQRGLYNLQSLIEKENKTGFICSFSKLREIKNMKKSDSKINSNLNDNNKSEEKEYYLTTSLANYDNRGLMLKLLK